MENENMEKSRKILAVTGPTATGKTALAVALARKFRGEIVSADSRQVYKHLDIGSGKDLAEFGSGDDRVPCHLIDVEEPGGFYHLRRFCADAYAAIDDISARGRLPIVVGGTALYLNALLRGYTLPGGAPDFEERARLDAMSCEELAELFRTLDPEAAGQFHDFGNSNRLRRAIEIARTRDQAFPVPFALNALILGVYYPRTEVRERIETRLDARLNQGLVEEVAALRNNPEVTDEWLIGLGLEYKFVTEYLRGELTRDEMRTLLLNRIRQFAKRQDIFFRKMERENSAIYWLFRGDREKAEELVSGFLAGKELPIPEFRLMNHTNGPRTQQKGNVKK